MWTKKEVCGLVDLTSLNAYDSRSEEHTSELQSRPHLVCRLLLEKKKTCTSKPITSTRNRARTPGPVNTAGPHRRRRRPSPRSHPAAIHRRHLIHHTPPPAQYYP